MRIRFFELLVIACLFVACAPPYATLTPQPQEPDLIQRFEMALDQTRKMLRIPGISVAVLRDQVILYKNGFGYADIENRIVATANTSYHIASLTKPFAATILMNLVENGQLRLNDELPVILENTDFARGGYRAKGYAELCKMIRTLAWRYGELLQDYRCHTNTILVKHHLTHTSQGLPGDRYRYNGFLFSFLTEVAEAVAGKPFDELLLETIIVPLEMTGTVPSINNDLRRQTLMRRAKYYQTDSLGRVVPSTKKPVALSASAGLISTVIDIAKFDVAMDRDLILSKASRKKMQSATISIHGDRLPYGMGWFVQKHKNLMLIWHYGHVPDAYSSLIVKIPDTALTMILLANSDGASRGFNLGKGDVLNSPFARLFLYYFAGVQQVIR